jgi:hypothetical protein
MEQLKISKVTALPAANALVKNTIYFVANASDSSIVEIYVTDNTASTARHVINKADIQSMINTAISNSSSLVITDTIATRDILTYTSPRFVYVKNATGDTSVTLGGATYLYDPAASGNKWSKVSEAESLYLVLQCSNIQNKPTSTVSDIDDAVTKKHTHSNKTTLDSLTTDVDGNLLVNGSLTHTGWDQVDW